MAVPNSQSSLRLRAEPVVSRPAEGSGTPDQAQRLGYRGRSAGAESPPAKIARAAASEITSAVPSTVLISGQENLARPERLYQILQLRRTDISKVVVRNPIGFTGLNRDINTNYTKFG